MMKCKTIAYYAPSGLGYNVWAPGADRPEFWFSSLQEVFDFARECGWKKIRRI